MIIPPVMYKRLPYFALAGVFATGMNLDIMEVDAAQYASISLEMLKSGNWLEVFDRNEDYLDKPPLLFWVTALSFKLLGVSSWQYKLPSVLFSLLGILSTFKLGALLYSNKIGHRSTLIFGSSLAMIMINNDVKTDTILVSSITFSLWMMVAAIKTNKLKYFLGTGLGITAAMLTKGPIGLMMPALAIGGHVILKRQWSSVLNFRWLFSLLVIAIGLVPMCVGLFGQFGTDGLEFYFWTQSFGRITGESSWQNDTTPFFFFHVFAWSFLPWTLLGLAGVLKELRQLKTNLSKPQTELYLISGIVLVWVALSFSKFKLPHYIFVVYPLVAILAAKFLDEVKRYAILAWVQYALTLLAVMLLTFILVYAFPNGGIIIPILMGLAIMVSMGMFFMSYRSSQVFWPAFVLSLAIGLGLNLHFYPQLLPYQANAYVGKWVNENQIDDEHFAGFSTGGRALDFYSGRIIPWINEATTAVAAVKPEMVIYANQARRDDLISRGYAPKRELVLENFEVQKLSVKFLNPKTRHQAIKKNYLMFY